MSENSLHGHNSQSEETYFYKETARLVAELRRMSEALQLASDKVAMPKAPVAADVMKAVA